MLQHLHTGHHVKTRRLLNSQLFDGDLTIFDVIDFVLLGM